MPYRGLQLAGALLLAIAGLSLTAAGEWARAPFTGSSRTGHGSMAPGMVLSAGDFTCVTASAEDDAFCAAGEAQLVMNVFDYGMVHEQLFVCTTRSFRILSSTVLDAHLLHAAPGHGVCMISGYRQ
jgi:hypothetical protein